jgi:outer membrane protein assembly factor BamB
LGTGYSGVVVAEGRLVTMFSDGRDDYVGALDAGTGEERWRVAIAPTFAGREGAVDGPCSTPAIHDGTVYALGPRGDLLAVRLDDGTTRWRVNLVERLGASTPHWGFTTSPLVVGDHVIVISGGADARIVTAFERHDGTEAWSAGHDESGVSYQSAALLTLDGV